MQNANFRPIYSRGQNMRKNREFIEGAFYHVTSRTNDKIRVFENRLGRKIMLMTLQDAKEKYRFRLANLKRNEYIKLEVPDVEKK